MAFGFKVFNDSGFVQVDSEALALKTMAKKATTFLSVSQGSSSATLPDIYQSSYNNALTDITANDVVFVRPTNINMFPCTISLKNYSGYNTSVDLAVRPIGAAGTIEIVRYVDLTDSEYTALVNALTGTRHGIRVKNSAGQVIFHSDLSPPSLKTILTSPNSYETFSGNIPFVCLNSLTRYLVSSNGQYYNHQSHAAVWKTVSSVTRVQHDYETVIYAATNFPFPLSIYFNNPQRIFIMEDT